MSRTWSELNALTGGLSRPSKMPGYAWGLPALSSCPVGGVLARKAGSVCSDCYAVKGRYAFANVQAAQHRRWKRSRDLEVWVPAMVESIAKTRSAWFRIHDSGDFYSWEYFLAWVDIAAALPDVKFWAPTRQYAFVRRFEREGRVFPSNLVVRLSAPMVDGAMPASFVDRPHSTVFTSRGAPGGADVRPCPAPSQGGVCGDCRACWDPSVLGVGYAKH